MGLNVQLDSEVKQMCRRSCLVVVMTTF